MNKEDDKILHYSVDFLRSIKKRRGRSVEFPVITLSMTARKSCICCKASLDQSDKSFFKKTDATWKIRLKNRPFRKDTALQQAHGTSCLYRWPLYA